MGSSKFSLFSFTSVAAPYHFLVPPESDSEINLRFPLKYEAWWRSDYYAQYTILSTEELLKWGKKLP